MFSHVTTLSWWKTDHTETSNEDAFLADATHGIFVVSDGVSTQFFSRLWATILTHYFQENPLISSDPFEVEWWLHPAQELYKQQAPDVKALHWSAQQKAKTGSAATLAAVRITRNDAAASPPVLAEFLAFGDSCIFIGNEQTQEVRIHFPIEQVSDFEKAPICVPSLPNKFNRTFHRCKLLPDIALQDKDILLLASDAVSKWIISRGAGSRESVWQAFAEIAACTPTTWHDFVTSCRHTQPQQMVDDDVTALVVQLHAEQQANDEMLGTTVGHSDATIQQRVQQFADARQRDNKEAVAVLYGDGTDIKRGGVVVPDEEIQKARAVADALAQVWQAFRSSINSSQFPKKVEDSWQKNAYLLRQEPCAQTLIEALQASGIRLQVKEDAISSGATQPISPNSGVPTSPDTTILATKPSVQAQLKQESTDKDFVDTLIAIMNNACNSNDDANILASYTPIPPRYRSSLPEHITKCVQLAEERTTARDQLQKTLRYATAQNMVHAYSAYRAWLHDHNTLSSQEQEQVRLAHALVDAEQQNNDDAVLRALDAIAHSDYHSRFQYTGDEQGKYKKIRNERAITVFRNTLYAPRLTVEQLWNTGNAAKEQAIYSMLTEEEQNKILLANTFYDAFGRNDTRLLVNVYVSILYSFPSLFTFMATEQKQIDEIRKILKKPVLPSSPVVLIGDDNAVAYEQLRKTYNIVKHYYLSRKQFLEQYINTPGFEQAASNIASLAAFLKTREIAKYALAYLVNDTFIQRGIQEQRNYNNTTVGRFEAEFKGMAKNLYENLSTTIGKNAGTFLKDAQVSKADLHEFFEMWARRVYFEKYVSEVWGMSKFDKWLKDRKQGVRCLFPEWAAEIRPLTNMDETKSWIFKWNGWDTNANGDM